MGELTIFRKETEYVYTVAEAEEKFFSLLAEATGWTYSKSGRALKKRMKDFSFEILFFCSKWNQSHKVVDVYAEFRLSYRKYGKLPVNNIIACMDYRPIGKEEQWFDISTETKLMDAYEEVRDRIQKTALEMYRLFEADVHNAAKELLEHHFEEYSAKLDFLADVLGKEAVRPKAQEIYDALSPDWKEQVRAYCNGDRIKAWMINRNNLKYIVDHELVVIPE